MLVVEAELLPPTWYQAGGTGPRVIDAERPATRFTEVAGHTNVKTEITEVIDYVRDPGRNHRAGGADRAGASVIHVAPTGLGLAEPAQSPMRVSS